MWEKQITTILKSTMRLAWVPAPPHWQRNARTIVGLGIALIGMFVVIPKSYASSPAATTVTLASSLNPSTYGQSVTFTATVSAASGTPTGKVTFLNGTSNLGSGTLTGGVASLSKASLSAGTKAITAVYGGSASFSGSTSSVLNQVVDQATSSLALTSSLNPSNYGQSVTFMAAVSATSGAPTGKVTFLNGTSNLGSATLTGGVASLSTTSLSAGTKAIKAVYGGSASISGSTSSILNQVVDPVASSVALTSSLNPSIYGQSVTFTATVTGASGTPSGNVTFLNGSSKLGTVALASGVANLNTTSLNPGSHTITAKFAGDAAYGAATASLTQTVTSKLPPAYSISVTALDPSSVNAGNTSTSTITLKPGNGYGGSVNLSCSILTGGPPAPTCSFNPSAVTLTGTGQGTATLTVATSSTTPAGTYTLSVTGSDANSLPPSNGPQTLTLTVLSPPGYTLIGSSLNPGYITAGGTSTSTITVSAINGYMGSVTLSCSKISGGTPAPGCAFNPSSVTVGGSSQGTSTLTVSTSNSAPTGTYSITVTGSDGNNAAPSNEPQNLNLTIVAAGSPSYFISSTALNPSSVAAGNNATSTITVTATNGYMGSVTLTCSSISGGTPAPSCSFNPAVAVISGNGATNATLTAATTPTTAVSSYSISVTGTDTNNLAPSNGPLSLTLAVAPLFQHIVIILQENRTPDNLFQDPVLIARGADIASSGINSLGQIIPLSPINLGTVGANPDNYDLDHSNTAFVSMYDGGKMDGADLVKCTPTAGTTCPPNSQFMYVSPADVQPYFALAEQYTFGDRMFQTNESSSYSSHQFIIAGTSAPTATSPLFASSIPYPKGAAGCIAAPGTLVTMIDATGSTTNSPPEYPCFEHQTLMDLLDSAGVTWRYYGPGAGSIWNGPNSIDHICQPENINGSLYCTGPDWTKNVVYPETQVLVDIANSELAQVTWVNPDGLFSDHSNNSNGTGPSWVASIVNAIGNSPYWANTVIFISWDDWGGWYDHVAPKVINDDVSWGSGFVYGFRVPLIVVSPYAKAGYISHIAHDFGSILKFIETNYNLPSLGFADTPADDMSDCFDLTQTPITFSVIPTPLDAAHFINDKHPPIDPDDD